MTPDIVLRPAATTDRAYILEHCVRSHACTAEAFHAGPHYTPGAWLTFESILDRSQCLVACAAKAPEVILGFAIVEAGKVVHYVFTRQDLRRQGIAKQLLAPLFDVKGIRFSFLPAHHACIKGRTVVPPKKSGMTPPTLPIPESWTYDPFTRVFGDYTLRSNV